MASTPSTDSPYDWLSLDDGEEIIWADTPHEYSLVPALVVGIPLSLVLVGLLIIAGSYLSYTNTNYVVTTTALYKKTGILSRDVQRIEFDKVQNTSYRQSALGAFFGYGTVDISTAGGTGVEMRFNSVAEPQAVQQRINERIKDRRGSADAGERDTAVVLDDIVNELRAIRVAVEGDADPATTGADETIDPIGDTDDPAVPEDDDIGQR